MQAMLRCFFVWLLLVLGTGSLLAGPDREAAWIEDARLAAVFQEKGLTGCFVLWDPERQSGVVHNLARAQQRLTPASTFKIPNTLIGLATGAVADVDTILPYGGKPQFLKVWERDMSLREAIKVSNVPIYQELARRIGLKQMGEYLTRFNYGNAETGAVVDRFWLSGPLAISAIEQVVFLNKLAHGQLPVPSSMQETVAEIILLEVQSDARLHGKTGWLMEQQPELGWFVGWVRKNEVIYPFALNVDLLEPGAGAERIPLAKACLAALQVWPAD